MLPEGPGAAEFKIFEDSVVKFFFAERVLSHFFLLGLCRVFFDFFSGFGSFNHDFFAQLY